MFIKRLSDCAEITANDGCRLQESLHPDRDDVVLPYSLAHAWVDAGGATFPHTLVRQTEVYVVLSGSGRMHIGEETEELGEGDSVVIPAGSTQWIENTGTEALHFIALVDPPWQAQDDVRVG